MEGSLVAVAPFDGKYSTSYLMTIVMYVLALIVYEIFPNQVKCQNFDLDLDLDLDSVTLVKVTEYNIRNGPIRWQIPTSIEIILQHFSLDLTVFDIFTF